MAGNFFDQYDGPAPAKSGAVYGAPKTATVAAPPTAIELEKIEMDRERLEFDRAEAADKAAEKGEKANKYANSKATALDSMKRVFQQLTDVAKAARDGWATTGKSGAFVRDSLPTFMSAGTDAYDLKRLIDTVDANSAFAALTEMRQNSPTGAALGAITERELDLLKATIASLDPNQSKDQLMKNVVKAKQAYVGMMRRIDPKAASKYVRQSSKKVAGGGAAKVVNFEDLP